MTTSRPILFRPSRAQGFLGLLAGLLLVLLPLLHTHPVAATTGGPAGQAHSSCTLCAVFAGMEVPRAEHVIVGQPPAANIRTLPLESIASATGITGVDGRAPPLQTV